MIAIDCINNIKENNEYDEVWAIVRSFKGSKISNLKQMKELAPSSALFYDFLKESKYKDYLFQKDYFKYIYVPRFIAEIGLSNKSQDILNSLIKTDKNICLVCYCKNEEICHRSIVAGILQHFGVQIKTEEAYNQYGEDLMKFINRLGYDRRINN